MRAVDQTGLHWDLEYWMKMKRKMEDKGRLKEELLEEKRKQSNPDQQETEDEEAGGHSLYCHQ